jgi:hypothetical protein
MTTSQRLLVAALCLSMLGMSGKTLRTFSVPLPAELRASGKVSLEFRGLDVAANRTGAFEVACVDAEGNVRTLASLPFTASADGKGMVQRASVVVALPPVSQWACKANPATTELQLRVRPVDGKGRSIDDLAWELRDLGFKK